MNHTAIANEMRKTVAVWPFIDGRGNQLERRPYQEVAALAIAEWLESTDRFRAYIEHATGTGKTTIMGLLANVFLKKKAPLLIVVPTLILAEQTIRRLFSQEFVEEQVSLFSSLKEVRGPEGELLAVASTDNMLWVTTYATLTNKSALFNDFKPALVVLDESHNAFSELRREALDSFAKHTKIIGFSATPDFLSTVERRSSFPIRLDNGAVLFAKPDRLAIDVLEERLHSYSIAQAISDGSLPSLSCIYIRMDGTFGADIVKGMSGATDYDEKQLQRALDKDWEAIYGQVVELMTKKRSDAVDLRGKKAIAVSHRKSAADQLTEVLRAAGIKAASLHDGVPKSDRAEILEAYRRGKVRFLSTVDMLYQGVDLPSAEVCFMLRLTCSRVRYTQTFGRVMRRDPDNPFKVAIVVDLLYRFYKHQPIRVVDLLLPPDSAYREGVPFLGKSIMKVSPNDKRAMKTTSVLVKRPRTRGWSRKAMIRAVQAYRDRFGMTPNIEAFPKSVINTATKTMRAVLPTISTVRLEYGASSNSEAYLRLLADAQLKPSETHTPWTIFTARQNAWIYASIHGSLPGFTTFARTGVGSREIGNEFQLPDPLTLAGLFEESVPEEAHKRFLKFCGRPWDMKSIFWATRKFASTKRKLPSMADFDVNRWGNGMRIGSSAVKQLKRLVPETSIVAPPQLPALYVVRKLLDSPTDDHAYHAIIVDARDIIAGKKAKKRRKAPA